MISIDFLVFMWSIWCHGPSVDTDTDFPNHEFWSLLKWLIITSPWNWGRGALVLMRNVHCSSYVRWCILMFRGIRLQPTARSYNVCTVYCGNTLCIPWQTIQTKDIMHRNRNDFDKPGRCSFHSNIICTPGVVSFMPKGGEFFHSKIRTSRKLLVQNDLIGRWNLGLRLLPGHLAQEHRLCTGWYSVAAIVNLKHLQCAFGEYDFILNCFLLRDIA